MIKNNIIFITGDAGFITNTLIVRMISNNKITVYENFHRDTITKNGYTNHPNLTIVKGDILDKEALTNAIKGEEIIVHAAGNTGMDTLDY